MSTGIVISLIVLAGVAFMGLMMCMDQVEDLSRLEKKIHGDGDVEYTVKYNAQRKKFHIEITTKNSSKKMSVYNRLGFTQYYNTAAHATVVMEKLKGNFQ